MSWRHPDAVGVIVIAVVGALVTYGGVTTPDPGFGVVTPAAFPTFLGVLMLASAGWLARDLVGASLPALDPIDRRPFVATLAATGLYMLALVPLGFIVSSTAYFLAESRILGSRAPVRDVIATALFVAAIYILFVQLLRIDLPRGPLPF